MDPKVHPAGSSFLPVIGLGALLAGLLLSCAGTEIGDLQGPTILLAGFLVTLAVVLFGLYFYSWVLMRHEIWRNQRNGQ